MATADKVDASFACVTAFAAMSASATAPAAIFAVVIALSAMSFVLTLPAKAVPVTTIHDEPFHRQVRLPDVKVSLTDGLAGNEIGTEPHLSPRVA
jgi:hypothetical protein